LRRPARQHRKHRWEATVSRGRLLEALEAELEPLRVRPVLRPARHPDPPAVEALKPVRSIGPSISRSSRPAM
jgi:hypothetical protein